MVCNEKECMKENVGRSKYCREHRATARKRWVAMISDKADERAEREKRWASLTEAATLAGQVAADLVTPAPIHVSDPRTGQSWTGRGGVCGYACVVIRPGNCSYAHWAKKNLGARRAYYGGVSFSVLGSTQSYEKRNAYATAFAEILRNVNIDAMADGSID